MAVSWGGAGARGDEASCRVSTQRSLLLDPPPRLLRTTGHLWPVWKDWPVAGPQAKVRAACSPGTRGLRSPACAPGRCEALQSICPGPCSQPPRTFPTWGLRRCPQAPVTPPGAKKLGRLSRTGRQVGLVMCSKTELGQSLADASSGSGNGTVRATQGLRCLSRHFANFFFTFRR